MKRCYLEFDPLKGYPVGKNIYYECGICGDVIPSMPKVVVVIAYSQVSPSGIDPEVPSKAFE